ncbi:MAG: hypothetical protein ACI9R3_001065 [Verrucomicrobiales bacterium]|jgi:hypothetical protein
MRNLGRSGNRNNFSFQCFSAEYAAPAWGGNVATGWKGVEGSFPVFLSGSVRLGQGQLSEPSHRDEVLY